jgi:hypothetical protein
LINQENLKNGSRFLVNVSLYQISALKLFPIAQNLVAKLGLQASLQVAPKVLTTKGFVHFLSKIKRIECDSVKMDLFPGSQ